MDIKYKLMGTAPGGLVVERSAGVREVVGSIPGQVIPKTLKMVLDASLPSARHLKGQIKDIWSVPPLSTVKCDRVECYINVPVI